MAAALIGLAWQVRWLVGRSVITYIMRSLFVYDIIQDRL